MSIFGLVILFTFALVSCGGAETKAENTEVEKTVTDKEAKGCNHGGAACVKDSTGKCVPGSCDTTNCKKSCCKKDGAEGANKCEDMKCGEGKCGGADHKCGEGH